MSGVRVLVGTAKGAFILSSDGKREKWHVEGPLFAGWTIYHMKGSPIDPNRIYASQCSDWFGQVIQRSDDGGKNWEQPGSEPLPEFTGHLPGPATCSSMKVTLEHTCGTTEHRIRGNSSESGTLNHPPLSSMSSMPERKTRLCFVRTMER